MEGQFKQGPVFKSIISHICLTIFFFKRDNLTLSMMVSVSLPTHNIKNKNLQIDNKLTISNHKDEIKK